MIELRGVTCRQGSFQLQDVSLRIEANTYAVLMGPTGRGKTTLLEVICGLRPVITGQVLIRGEDVTRWSPGMRRLGYVPQDLALFPHLNVAQNLQFALRMRGASRNQQQARTAELADLLGIAHLLARKVAGLSGGEAQRVALGRAIADHPSVLLLDEPLSALDTETRQEMHALLLRLKEATGMTTLHVTHNREEATALADQLLLLVDGQIIEQRSQ